MGYIYCITNLINSKKYIGKTTNTIQDRFKQHCKEHRKKRCRKRPLYDAMNKYGIENFKIDELEYIQDNNLLSDREIYWINELQTYGCNGYNATKGGDGIILYDHNEIIELYNLGYSTTQVAEKIGCDITWVNRVLKAKGIKTRSTSKQVLQYDLAGNYIQTFDSIPKAVKWLHEHGITNNKKASNAIHECCQGKRPKIYNYIWKYVVVE